MVTNQLSRTPKRCNKPAVSRLLCSFLFIVLLSLFHRHFLFILMFFLISSMFVLSFTHLFSLTGGALCPGSSSYAKNSIVKSGDKITMEINLTSQTPENRTLTFFVNDTQQQYYINCLPQSVIFMRLMRVRKTLSTVSGEWEEQLLPM